MDVTIEKLIYGGEGLAHHGGSTVFVPFVLPAEKVAVTAVEHKKKFVRGRLERILEPSAERIPARCPHFAVCGGCDYQHIPYDQQLHFKSEILRETLRRIGRIDWTGEIVAHGSPPWEYRNRAQWKIRPPEPGLGTARDGMATQSKDRLAIGYFRASSTALCAVEDCFIISPLLLKTLLALREALAAGLLPRGLREIEAFVDAADSKLLLTAAFAGFPSRTAEHAETFRRLAPEVASLLFYDPSHDRMELFGPGFLDYQAGEATYRVGHFSFFQVNRFLIQELVREVVKNEEAGRLALDLFAGVGLFSLPLAKGFERLISVESNPAASRDLESNVGGKGTVEVRTAEVERFLARNRERPELVVLDPPRSGLEPGTVESIAKLGPARITYVSCDPPTLSRDLA
ncbi:MAG: 23S rRNA (uracil(1939)-C(5))-methyltransferase RlmD, partial [Candidatus Acidiferrales bacterium]